MHMNIVAMSEIFTIPEPLKQLGLYVILFYVAGLSGQRFSLQNNLQH